MEGLIIYTVCVIDGEESIKVDTVKVFSVQEAAEKWIKEFIMKEDKWHLSDHLEGDDPHLVKYWVEDKGGDAILLKSFYLGGLLTSRRIYR